MRFILASASPRRKELLEQIGVKFDILPATGEEVITKELPGEVVMELAKQKAEEVAKTAGADALVLGADTVVAYEGKILGKPKDEADALRMLATVYKGNIIKNLIMDCQSYTKYRPNETTGGIFVSWRRKEELPTGA